MIKKYISDQQFDNLHLSEEGLEKAEYENCTFHGCLLNGTNLKDLTFSECEFIECDLSNCKIDNTSFRQVQFNDCKMLGLHFEHCNPFLLAVNFNGCTLNFSSFYQLNLKGTSFEGCSLREVDLTETNLENGGFVECDLTNAIFDRTNLNGADLRSAFGFSIDPSVNMIRKAKFSRNNLQGLLNGFGIIIE